MKKINFQNLISAAQNDQPPMIDVTDSVMSKIADYKPQTLLINRQLMWISIASSAAAAGFIVTAILLSQQTSSANNIFNLISWVVS